MDGRSYAAKMSERTIADLTPNPRNARSHSRRQIAQIAQSIERFGFTNPILVDEVGTVLAGHGRLAAAESLGLETVPTVCIDHLTEVEKRAYVLADNKIALNAGWDTDLLASELGDLADLLPSLDESFNLEITGFATASLIKSCSTPRTTKSEAILLMTSRSTCMRPSYLDRAISGTWAHID